MIVCLLAAATWTTPKGQVGAVAKCVGHLGTDLEEAMIHLHLHHKCPGAVIKPLGLHAADAVKQGGGYTKALYLMLERADLGSLRSVLRRNARAMSTVSGCSAVTSVSYYHMVCSLFVAFASMRMLQVHNMSTSVFVMVCDLHSRLPHMSSPKITTAADFVSTKCTHRCFMHTAGTEGDCVAQSCRGPSSAVACWVCSPGPQTREHSGADPVWSN